MDDFTTLFSKARLSMDDFTTRRSLSLSLFLSLSEVQRLALTTRL